MKKQTMRAAAEKILPRDKTSKMAAAGAGALGLGVGVSAGMSIPATVALTLGAAVGASVITNNRKEAYDLGLRVGKKIRGWFRKGE